MSLSSHVQIVTLPDHTDADPNHLPDKAGYVRVDPQNIYLQKCAELWMKNQWPQKWQSGKHMPDGTIDEGQAELSQGVMYYLEQLPRGYALYERARPGNPSIRDKFLYGHPTHKVFYSPNEFYAHLEHLMLNNGVSLGCPCKRCAGGTPRHFTAQTTARATPMVVVESPSRSTSASAPAPVSRIASVSSSAPSSGPAPVKRRPGRPPKRFDTEALTGPLLPDATHADLTEDERATSAAARTLYASKARATVVDEEDTPDTMRRLLDKLERLGTIDEEIKEPLSMDWLAVNASIHSWLDKLSDQPAWIPRAGEVVLFVRQLPPRAEISYDSRSKTFRVWQDGKWLKEPMWEAGVIAQESSTPLKTEDITRKTQQQTSVTYCGFRIEPLPAPNQNDKRLTLRYTYVPMHQIRPFSLSGDVIPPDTAVHETITNAILITSTVAVVGKYRIQGVWPRAEILCKGVYIGAEFLMLNDVVRLSTPSDFMQIRAIKLILTDLDTDAPWTRIFIEGCAFTTDRRRSVGQDPVDIQVLPTIFQNFDEVYPLQSPKTRKRVTLNDVMGRLIEPHALGLWLPQHESGFEEPLVLTSTTIRSVVKAREYSSRNDERIPGGIRWFWAETRLEALDVTSLNGVAASKHDNMRDDRLEAEQKAARVLARLTARNQAEMKQAVRNATITQSNQPMLQRAAAPISDIEETGREEGETDDVNARLDSGGLSHDDGQDDALRPTAPAKRRASVMTDESGPSTDRRVPQHRHERSELSSTDELEEENQSSAKKQGFQQAKKAKRAPSPELGDTNRSSALLQTFQPAKKAKTTTSTDEPSCGSTSLLQAFQGPAKKATSALLSAFQPATEPKPVVSSDGPEDGSSLLQSFQPTRKPKTATLPDEPADGSALLRAPVKKQKIVVDLD